MPNQLAGIADMQYTLSHDELFKRYHDKELSEYAREHYLKTLEYRANCGSEKAKALVNKVKMCNKIDEV